MTTATEAALEIGGEVCPRAASQQAAHEAALPRADQGGNGGREQEFGALVRSEEAREALGAFLEKHHLPAEFLR